MRPIFRINKSETGVDEIESETAKSAFVHGIIFDLICSAERFAGDSLDALLVGLADFVSETISIWISISVRVAKSFPQPKDFSLPINYLLASADPESSTKN